MPSLTESLTICLSVLAPWRCPSSTGSPRASAQRAFPSMMIATFSAVVSDFEDFVFLVLQELVDLVHALVGELLERLFRAMLVGPADVAVLLELAEVVHDVAADIAHRHASVLGDPAYDAHQVLAPLLGQLRDRQADHVAVVTRRQPEVVLHDRLLDRLDRALVVGRPREHPRLGRRDVRQLLQRRLRAVVVDAYAVEQRRRRATGAHGPELRLRGVDRLGHPALRVVEELVDQLAFAHVETRVPTRSPETIRWILASSSMLK